MTPLYPALLAAVSFALPNGQTAPVAHIRRLGPAYVAELAEHIEQAALVHGIEPELLAALLVEESGLNPAAVNAYSGSWGIAQLNPRGKWSRVARRECARAPRLCRWHEVFMAAELLRLALDTCGDELLGVGHYRRGRCQAGKRDLRVLRLRDRMRSRGQS